MELFMKRFIDLLDERIPVSMVHTLVEQPLGAIVNDSYLRIHARLDLLDEDSPFVEMELYPYEFDKIEVQMAFNYPGGSINVDENTLSSVIEQAGGKGEKVVLLGDYQGTYFEMYQGLDIQVPQKSEMDETIEEIVGKIYDWLLIGGYQPEEGDEE